MTLGVLQAAIRQVPGIRGLSRYQNNGKDRLYLSFSLAKPCTGIYVELPAAYVAYNTRDVMKWHGGDLWRTDPHGLGERAVKTIRALCDQYRAERAPMGAGRK